MHGLVRWLMRWGFATVVGACLVAAGCASLTARVPTPVPDFALRAGVIYRIEIGAAAFLGLYLVAMAFVLALNNRGFSEVGVNGLKAQDMANKAQQDAIDGHEDSLSILREMVGEIDASTKASARGIEKRIERLEAFGKKEGP